MSVLRDQSRLFGNSPRPPAENRPGMDQRGDFRRIASGNMVPDAPPNPLLTPEDLARTGDILKQFTAL